MRDIVVNIVVRARPRVGERMDTIGVDWGPKGLILVHREKNYGIYKIPGHKTWTSNFSPWRYHATRYGIVEFHVGDDEHHWGKIDLIYNSEVAPGTGWRKTLEFLKIDVHRLVNTTTIGELINERQ